MRTSITLGLGLPVVAALAAAVALLSGSLSSRAVQAPVMSLDMDPADNSYDAASNTMTVGTTDGCVASETANPGTHTHTMHVVIQNVEDLIGWQGRLNFDPSAMKPVDVDFAPFLDTNGNEPVSFVNMPIDRSRFKHREIVRASTDLTSGAASALIGSVYLREQYAEISPDTPAKSPPDDSSYSAPTGGVVAAVKLEVEGDQSGRTLYMQLDDNNPYPPGSKLVTFTSGGYDEINFSQDSLTSGYHAEGASACASVPTPTNAPTKTPFVPPLSTDLPTPLPTSILITDPWRPIVASPLVLPPEPAIEPIFPTAVPAPLVVGARMSESQASSVPAPPVVGHDTPVSRAANSGASRSTATEPGAPPSTAGQDVAGALSLPHAGASDTHEGWPRPLDVLLVACAVIALAAAAAAGIRWRRRQR